MAIHTVLGPIDATELGPTSMHEHLLVDGSVYHTPVADDERVSEPLTMSGLGPLRWDYIGYPENLRLDDPHEITSELELARAAGASGVVDLTVAGIGPRVADLPAIARATGLHIMVGCGVYIDAAHPPWVAQSSVDDLRRRFVDELQVGIADTEIRAALLGEIGTSDPITPAERNVLRAAGEAGAETGAAVSVHQTTGRHGLAIIELLTDADMSVDRIVICHLDDDLDHAYHRALAETGAVVDLDTFGHEAYVSRDRRWPSDLERLEAVAALIDGGFGGQLVLGCDVWSKGALRRYGGMGYEHLFRRIVPLLRDRCGASNEDVTAMLVETPRRLLDRG